MKKTNRALKVLSLILALCMALSLAACGSSAAETPSTTAAPATDTAETTAAAQTTVRLDEPIQFNVTTSNALDSAFCVNLQKAYDAITERTNGDLTFVIYPSSQLGSTTETLEQMRAGAPIICSLGFDNIGDYVPKMQIASAPYVFNDTSEVQILGASDWMKEVEQDMYAAGFAPLAYGSLGYRHFISSKPIEDASSIKGMIVRMGNSSLAQNFITVMGGNPTTSSWNDNYSSIQQGIFDACEASAELLYNSSLYEVCDYLTLSGHFVTPTVLTMNTIWWDKLPEEYQQIMREELTKGMANILADMTEAEAGIIEKFKEAGVTVIETDKSTFAAYVPELLEKLGLDSAEYDNIRAAIEAGK